MAKDVILYFEDNEIMLMLAQVQIGRTFPQHRLVTSLGEKDCVAKVLKQTGGIERIAIVCTDGQLVDSMGWDILSELKSRGYTGPALYSGSTNLPRDKEHLYTGKTRFGEPIDESIKKHIQ
jgi:hypothetical protein